MSASEITDWVAYEQVYGPILVHERIDVGLAQLGLILVRLLSKNSRHKLRDFLPSWYQEARKTSRSPDAVLRGFEQLFQMAEANADNQHPDR